MATWFRIAMIHSCCSSSAAVHLFAGSLIKHFFKKSIPNSLNWSFVGNCGGLPPAIFHIIAHSLSRFAQGRRPVAISRITHPRDHTSIAPCWPGILPVITSGDMYMGVPVMVLSLPPRDMPPTSAAKVFPWRAIILAAPKSTYLMTPLWSSRMSETC